MPPPDEPLTAWYDTNAEGFSTLLHRLAETRAAAANDVAGMEARGRKAIWWPFTQHDNLGQGKVNLLDSAYGDYFCAAEVERGSDSRAGGEDEVKLRATERKRLDAREKEGRRRKGQAVGILSCSIFVCTTPLNFLFQDMYSSLQNVYSSRLVFGVWYDGRSRSHESSTVLLWTLVLRGGRKELAMEIPGWRWR